MKLWIAKDNFYNIYTREPTSKDLACSRLRSENVWINVEKIMCIEGFERITGIKLKHGQFCQIEVKQIGDVRELT